MLHTAAHVVNEKKEILGCHALLFVLCVFTSLSESRATAEQQGTFLKEKSISHEKLKKYNNLGKT